MFFQFFRLSLVWICCHLIILFRTLSDISFRSCKGLLEVSVGWSCCFFLFGSEWLVKFKHFKFNSLLILFIKSLIKLRWPGDYIYFLEPGGLSVTLGGKHDASSEKCANINDSIWSKLFPGSSLAFVNAITFTLSYPAFIKQLTA